ncbi:unnamed protein product [Closterium sp. NIES-64]|nr:unnamed protein product [Closterium sp. NIES-64]
MATPSVLTFDAEGRPVDFEVCVDDLQLFLQCDRADGLSLFDLTSGASPAPAANADPTVRSQWATRDAAARLAGCSPSPLLPSVASAAAADLVGLESVSAASTPSGRRRSGKGKGGKGAGGGGRGSGGGDGGREEGVVVAVGVVAGVGALVAAVEAEEVAVVAVRAGVAEVEAVVEVAATEVEL